MIVGILGHAVRFGVFAFFPESKPLIVIVQVLHGICYAFYFATVYIFIDAAFPKDVRTSAQGLFNLLILGLDDVFYRQGPLLTVADPSHGIAVLAVVTMNAQFGVATMCIGMGQGAAGILEAV